MDDTEEAERESQRGQETPLKVDPKLSTRCATPGGQTRSKSSPTFRQSKCMGAALSQNLGAMSSPQVWSSMTSEIPSHLFAGISESTGSELSKQRKWKATEEAKARRHQSKYPRVENSLAARRSYSRHNGEITKLVITAER